MGKFDLNVASVQQGFRTYVLSTGRKNAIHESLDFAVYSNPFTAHLKIDFPKKNIMKYIQKYMPFSVKLTA
jgi:hypothetical protein